MCHLFKLILVLTFGLTVYGQLSPERTIPDPPGIYSPKAVYLGRPKYPAIARSVRASGQVSVKITIDEKGNVVAAEATTGHPLLRPAAVGAALESKFLPMTVGGKAVRTTASITFNFSASERQPSWEEIGSNLVTLINGRPPVSAGTVPKGIIWQGLDEEYKTYASFQESEVIDDKPQRAGRLLNTLRFKLKDRPIDVWYLNLGAVMGGLSQSAGKFGGGQLFNKYLDKLGELVKNAPADFPPKRLEAFAETIKKVREKELSREERGEIIKLLVENRNLSLN